MNILHLTFSPRHSKSLSTRLSEDIVHQLQSHHDNCNIIRRDLGSLPLARIDDAYAQALSNPASLDSASMNAGAMAESETLIRELEAADIVVIGTPMHNFTVPVALKAWIDLVVRIHRSFAATPQGKVGKLRDRPVYIAIASGGYFGTERARQPDFLTPYLKAILGTIGLHDLRFSSEQGTALAGEKQDISNVVTASA